MDRNSKIEWWHRIKSCPTCGAALPDTEQDSEIYWNEDGSISVWYYAYCRKCDKTWALNDFYALEEPGIIFATKHDFD